MKYGIEPVGQVDEVFYPKSVAIIGASTSNRGQEWVSWLHNFGYPGPIYPINPRVTEVMGLRAYPSVRDIPGPVDYVIFSIPARQVPQAMTDCVAKGIKVAHVYAAGFGELGEAEATLLQSQALAIARAAGIRIIGPNCMGVYCPASGMTFRPDFSREGGSVSFISQTGGGATRFVYLANSRHIYFNKVISYGNAVDIDSPELLDYLADDDSTSLIVGYIEGVRNGPAFLKAVRKCLIKKPVVILKAGLTAGGAGAAASHTASMAGSAIVWDTFFRQSGAIRVNSMEELADVTLALLRIPGVQGRRVGLLGKGGGLAVLSSDACERAGLKMPPLAPETRQEFEKYIPKAGSVMRNPVEPPRGMQHVAAFYPIGLPIMASDPNVDFIITTISVDVHGRRRVGEGEGDHIFTAAETLTRVVPDLNKPLAVVLYSGERIEAMERASKAREHLLKAGLAVFPTIEAAAGAINRVITFNETRRSRTQEQ